MNRPVIFEDEALQFVRDARKVRKSIILPCDCGTIEYSLRNVNYDGIYESEWKPTDSKCHDIGLSDRGMAEKVYELCNKNNSEPHLKGE